MKKHYQRTLLTVCFCFAFVFGFAQVKVYKGNSSYSSDVICNLKDNKVYKGNSSYTSDIPRTIPPTAVISCSPSGMAKSIEGRHRIHPMLFSQSRMASSTKAIRAIHQTFLPIRKVSKCIKTTPAIRRMSISPYPTMSPSNSLWPFGMRWSIVGRFDWQLVRTCKPISLSTSSRGKRLWNWCHPHNWEGPSGWYRKRRGCGNKTCCRWTVWRKRNATS